MLISVVVPCFNEEEVIEETHRRLCRTLETQSLPFEIIYVDDGSRDGTIDRLHAIQGSDRRVRLLALSRNFGHQIAATAGLEHASGDAVILIDADLQDPPEAVLEMIRLWRQGYHVVYGTRTDRQGETRFKLLTAKLFYRLINRLSDISIPLDTGDFRLMDRKVVDALLTMPERDRFLRGMVSWIGFRQTSLPYRREPRYAGRSKYPLGKMLAFALNGIISFSTTPLRFATWIGFAASGLALMGIVYALLLRFFTTIWVTGWTLLFIAVLFMGGVQLISLGMIGEYLGRTYGEVKRRPLYFLLERSGFDDDRHPSGTG